MSMRRLRCVGCGAVWISASAQELIERSEACLQCAGALAVADETLPDPGPDLPADGVTKLVGEMLTWARSIRAPRRAVRSEEH